MNNLKIQLICSVLIILFLSSCSDKEYQEMDSEVFQLNYSNGQKYCEGTNRVYSNGEKSYKVKDGIWRFYDLEGNPDKIKEYNYDELISYKEFNELGKVIVSEIITDNAHTLFRYYGNGNLKFEKITKLEIEEDYAENDQGQSYYYDTEYSYTTIKEYHKNGQLKTLRKKEDDFSIGTVKVWDDKGNLVIEHETLE